MVSQHRREASAGVRAVSVSCEACNGTGQRALTQVEIDTLRAIGAGWATTAEILPRLARVQGYETSQTALCNRLAVMGDLELVEYRRAVRLVSRRGARGYEWRARSKR